MVGRGGWGTGQVLAALPLAPTLKFHSKSVGTRRSKPLKGPEKGRKAKGVENCLECVAVSFVHGLSSWSTAPSACVCMGDIVRKGMVFDISALTWCFDDSSADFGIFCKFSIVLPGEYKAKDVRSR